MFNKIKRHFKTNWFQYLLVVICVGVFNIMSGLGGQINAKRCITQFDRPSCYLFYGVAQDKSGDDLKVNFHVENIPNRPHTVLVELVNQHTVDLMYSQKHDAKHNKHHTETNNKYSASYKIANLKPGKYKLRVTFQFKYLLGIKSIISNDIEFTVDNKVHKRTVKEPKHVRK